MTTEGADAVFQVPFGDKQFTKRYDLPHKMILRVINRNKIAQRSLICSPPAGLVQTYAPLESRDFKLGIRTLFFGQMKLKFGICHVDRRSSLIRMPGALRQF